MDIFKGFTTIGRIRAPYRITGNELIKRDLLVEFYTKLGERVMRPNFGSIIWDLLMDPQDDRVENRIKEDVEKIVGRDPRVELVNTTVIQLDKSIRVEVDIRILPHKNPERLYLEYQRQIAEGVN
jgi:phage baseplate assembly protein W